MAQTSNPFNKIKKDLDLKSSEDDILSMGKNYFINSETFVSGKREKFVKRNERYSKPDKTTGDQIYIQLCQQHIKGFISTFYDADMYVDWQPQEFSDEEKSYKLNYLANYHNKAMGKPRKDFFHFHDMAFYGPAIRYKFGWDNARKMPLYKNISPQFWLPDPNGSIINGFKYHIFETNTTINELEARNKQLGKDVYFNLDKINKGSLSDHAQTVMASKDSERLLNEAVTTTELFTVRNAFMEVDGKKYSITFANKGELLIRMEEIPAVSKEEKENPYLIPYPISISNIFPLDGDPFGLGYMEAILDFQNAKNKLMNLALNKELHNAGFGHYFVDAYKFPNASLLSEKAINGPIYHAIDTGNEQLSSPVIPMDDRERVEGSTFDLDRSIDIEAQKTTMMTDFNRGLGGQSGTLGQDKMQQINSNITFLLDFNMISFGEEDFWKNIRYRDIKSKLKDTDEILARIGTGVAAKQLKVKKRDLVCGIDPDVRVTSKKLDAQKDKKLLAYMIAREAMVMQDPNTPEISKKFYKRELDQLNGVSREKVFINTPLSSDERRAMEYVVMINNDTVPKNLFKPGMDLFTYWIYIQGADNTTAKRVVLKNLENAMLEEGVNVPPQGQAPGQQGETSNIRNSMGSQLTSALVQEGIQGDIPSRAEVSPLAQ